MSITLQSLPFIFIGCIVIGIILIVISIFKISNTKASVANLQESDKHTQVAELFSYFLQEEEYKNEEFRKSLLNEYQNIKVKEEIKEEVKEEVKEIKKKMQKQVKEGKEFNTVIQEYKEGKSIEEIAKKLKKGVGEVKLIISLYSMGE